MGDGGGRGERGPSGLAAARLWATHRYPYLSSALFALDLVVVDGIGTTAVDRAWRLYVDPVEVERRSAAELGVLLVHHCGHLLRDHAGRAHDVGVDDALASAWTVATDAEINDDLEAAGHVLGPDEVTPERIGCPPGRLAEEYLSTAEPGSADAAPDHGSGVDGRPRRWDRPPQASDVSPLEADLLRRRVAEDVLLHMRAGDVPLGWRRWATERLRSTVDWRRLLAGEIRSGVAATAGLVDYSYTRPSRRAGASPGIVLPALRRPVPHVAVVVDTSASVDDAHLALCLGEVEGVIRRLGLTDATVLAVDADVHLVRRTRRARDVELRGGGGTDMAAGLRAVAALVPRPGLVVVLTDGHTPWPDRPPPGVRVVVGLLGDPQSLLPEPPGWARTVVVPPAELATSA